MKLSLCINAPEDTQGADDGDSNTIPNERIEHISEILQEELLRLYPVSESYEAAEISLSFVRPEEIRELNREYRNIDEATDVLSFPIIDIDVDDEPSDLPVLTLGDIVICPEEVSRLHPEMTHNDAINLMIAHSFLHLLGYDHDSEEKQNEMWALQEEIAGRLK